MGYSPHTRSWLESRQAPGSARARRETWDGLFHHAQEICEGGWQSDKQSASQRFPSWQPLQLALQHLQPSPRLPIPLAHGLRHPGPVAHRQTLTWPSVAAWPPRPRIRRFMRTSNVESRTRGAGTGRAVHRHPVAPGQTRPLARRQAGQAASFVVTRRSTEDIRAGLRWRGSCIAAACKDQLGPSESDSSEAEPTEGDQKHRSGGP
jgi:hypothetical protein